MFRGFSPRGKVLRSLRQHTGLIAFPLHVHRHPRLARNQQRLVAEFLGGSVEANARGRRGTTPIPAREDIDRKAAGAQSLGQTDGKGGFPRTAGGKVADADDREVEAANGFQAAVQLPFTGCEGKTVERSKREQQTARQPTRAHRRLSETAEGEATRVGECAKTSSRIAATQRPVAPACCSKTRRPRAPMARASSDFSNRSSRRGHASSSAASSPSSVLPATRNRNCAGRKSRVTSASCATRTSNFRLPATLTASARQPRARSRSASVSLCASTRLIFPRIG